MGGTGSCIPRPSSARRAAHLSHLCRFFCTCGTSNKNRAAHNGNLPPHNGNLPSHNGNLPSHNGNLSSHNGNLPPHNGNLPPHNGNLSSHNGNLSSHNGNLSSRYAGDGFRYATDGLGYAGDGYRCAGKRFPYSLIFHEDGAAERRLRSEGAQDCSHGCNPWRVDERSNSPRPPRKGRRRR
jgi:hypothetical protein